MAYVIGQACISVKDTACVDACPTDSIHSIEGASQYYIDPDTCIDCDACRPACPVSAIYAGDQVPEAEKKFIKINTDFFKGFDKAKSTAYTRPKKEGAQPGAVADAGAAKATEEGPQEAKWVEVEGWEALWQMHEGEPENRLDRDKRYGRVRAVYESQDTYTLRFFTPERTPNHPFRYRYGLPETMSSYELTASLMGGRRVLVTGRIKDRGIAKLCGYANSFPDRFQVEYEFPRRVASVSVQARGPHAVDVVALKDTDEAQAA